MLFHQWSVSTMEYSFSLLVFQNKAPANINLCQGPIRTLAGSKTGVATFLNKTCEQAPGEGKKFGKWSESMNMKKKNGFEKEAAIFSSLYRPWLSLLSFFFVAQSWACSQAIPILACLKTQVVLILILYQGAAGLLMLTLICVNDEVEFKISFTTLSKSWYQQVCNVFAFCLKKLWFILLKVILYSNLFWKSRILN